jgi:hypothetical protein
VVRKSARAIAVLVSAVAMLLVGTVSAAARPPVPVHSSTYHPVSAPDVMRPGLVHLRNTGGSELYLFRKIHAGAPTLLADLNESLDSDGPGALARHFTIIDVINPRTDVYVRLLRGTYYLVDATAERYHRADIHKIVVTGARDDATAPHSRPVSMTRHHGLVAPRAVHAGKFVHLRNASSRLMAFVYFRVNNSATTQQINDFLAHPGFENLFPLIYNGLDAAGSLGYLSGHQHVYVRFPAHAARYLILALPAEGTGSFLAANRVRLVTAR